MSAVVLPISVALTTDAEVPDHDDPSEGQLKDGLRKFSHTGSPVQTDPWATVNTEIRRSGS